MQTSDLEECTWKLPEAGKGCARREKGQHRRSTLQNQMKWPQRSFLGRTPALLRRQLNELGLCFTSSPELIVCAINLENFRSERSLLPPPINLIGQPCCPAAARCPAPVSNLWGSLCQPPNSFPFPMGSQIKIVHAQAIEPCTPIVPLVFRYSDYRMWRGYRNSPLPMGKQRLRKVG